MLAFKICICFLTKFADFWSLKGSKTMIKPVFQTRKIGQILALKEKKAPHYQQSMRGLQISMWSVRRRLCRVHRPTFTPAH